MNTTGSFPQSKNEQVSCCLRVKRLLNTSVSSMPFRVRETQELLSFYDAYHPNDPIHIVWPGDDKLLLHFRISVNAEDSLLIKEINGIRLKLPDNRLIDLQMHQVHAPHCSTLKAFCVLETHIFREYIGRNIVTSSSGSVGHTHCQKCTFHVHVTSTDPHRPKGILYFSFRYKCFLHCHQQQQLSVLP